MFAAVIDSYYKAHQIKNVGTEYTEAWKSNQLISIQTFYEIHQSLNDGPEYGVKRLACMIDVAYEQYEQKVIIAQGLISILSAHKRQPKFKTSETLNTYGLIKLIYNCMLEPELEVTNWEEKIHQLYTNIMNSPELAIEVLDTDDITTTDLIYQ